MASLPFTTAAVESAIFKTEVIKTDRRSGLQTSTLDDLLEIHFEGPGIKDFYSTAAVVLWWQDCMRRPNQSSTISMRLGGSAKHQDLESESCISLDQWDELFP